MSQIVETAHSAMNRVPEAGTVEAMQHEFVQSRNQGPFADSVSANSPTANLPDAVPFRPASEHASNSATAGAPVEYNLDIPETVKASVPQEKIDEFTSYARAAGLSNEQAQAALNFKIQLNRDYEDTHRQQVAQWENQVRADPELGGKNMDITVATATRAMQHYDPTGHISTLLCESGHGSNPEVVRFLYRIGKSLGEDSVPFSNSSVRSEASLGERMYPNFKF